jgi:hypothetical protein
MDPSSTTPVATLIGDVVASRAATDRSGLHERLTGLLVEANERLAPIVPLRITVRRVPGLLRDRR